MAYRDWDYRSIWKVVNGFRGFGFTLCSFVLNEFGVMLSPCLFHSGSLIEIYG